MNEAPNPSRRQFVFASAAGATLTIVPALIPAAFGKAPLAGSQIISVHRMQLGSFELTALLDGYVERAPTILVGDQGLVKNLLTAGGWSTELMRLPVIAFLLNTGDKLVLFDSGGANLLGPAAGRLPQCLAAAGVEPGQIDEVYITHMHPDHMHGVVKPDGSRLFPNAIIRISKNDMEYWANPEVQAKAPENMAPRFLPAKRAVAAYGERIKPFNFGEELTPGVRAVEATGHSPGHSCFMVQSGAARLMIIGDTIHVAPVQFPHAEITVIMDGDQAKARTMRKSIFEMAVAEGIPIAGAHLPFPGIGRLRKNGDAYVFDVVPWQLF
jgi:glyoxylase-like metal-dependent hydrolase (beta-lactamase superfamily II)